VNARPVLLPLLAAAALAACGGNPEKAALRAYEAGVENLMEEDGKISAQLKDIQDDLLTSTGAAAEDQSRFARDQALPFYKRFREAAAKASASGPRLPAINSDLLAYLDERVGYIEAIETFLAASKSASMDRLNEAQGPWQAAQKELQSYVAKGSGKVEAQDVAEAVNTRSLFMNRVYEPFQRGQVEGESVEKALREQVLPRLVKVAERTKGDLAAPGEAGAVARWAAAEVAFYREMEATIPQQAILQKAGTSAVEHWSKSVDMREKYLASLRSYRDSLR